MGDGGQAAVSRLMLLERELEGFYVGDLTLFLKNVKGLPYSSQTWWYQGGGDLPSCPQKAHTQIGEMSFCLWTDEAGMESCFDVLMCAFNICMYYML